MKKKLLGGIIAYTVCACMIFTPATILASDISSSIGENNTTILNTTSPNIVVPESWGEINATYLTSMEGKTLDISALSQTASKIEIPATVSNIIIKGDSSKIYNGLSIIVKARTNTLNLGIKNLNIDGSDTGIDITENAGITNIILQGNNSIVSTGSNGIAVYTGNTLVISADSNTSSLTIQAGNQAAGIGGRFYTGAGAVKKGNGKIIINTGTLNITGGNEAAAIGSATDEESEIQDITINGGNITATGGIGGAGIGTGRKQNKSAGKIIINGGNIIATGGMGGAGIGSGADLNSGTPFDIAITGGTITAVGNAGGAGIGGGNKSHVNDIVITGGIIERAEGSGNSAGIGGGGERGFRKLQIGANNVKSNNPTIKNVKGGLDGACAIGTGAKGSGTGQETILLYSGVIEDLFASGGAAAIGGGDERGVKEIQVGCTRIGKVYSEGGGTAIGGGRIGQNGEGKVIILPGAVIYADTDGESVLGGGEDRSLPVVVNGDVFLGKNNIDYIESQDPDIRAYAFECYKVTGKDELGNNIRTKMIAGDFAVKNSNDATIDLKPTTDGSGRIYAWLHDLGIDRLGSSGYYFRINEAGKTFHAVEFNREAETFMQKMKGPDGNITNVEVPVAIIQMEFVEVQFSEPTVSVNSGSGSKIVPYSTSNIDFVSKILEDTSVAKEGPDSFEWVKAKIDLNKLDTDITPFDLSDSSKIKLIVSRRDGFEGDGVTPKYTYDASLTTAMSGSGVVACDNVNKIITINYPNSMKQYGEFKIRILVPNILTKDIDKYVDENVRTAIVPDQAKMLNVELSFKIITHIRIDGLTLDEPREAAGNTTIDAKYWYLTKIN